MARRRKERLAPAAGAATIGASPVSPSATKERSLDDAQQPLAFRERPATGIPPDELRMLAAGRCSAGGRSTHRRALPGETCLSAGCAQGSWAQARRVTVTPMRDRSQGPSDRCVASSSHYLAPPRRRARLLCRWVRRSPHGQDSATRRLRSGPAAGQLSHRVWVPEVVEPRLRDSPEPGRRTS